MSLATPGAAPPLFIVFNPGSGDGDPAQAREAIEAGCAAAGRALHLFVVDAPDRLQALAEEAAQAAHREGGIVVAAGGDGTINTVAQRAHQRGCAFGVLPQGTFNYFSRTHGIPAPTGEALALLLRARPQPVQVGRVNERLFLVNASMGLYARLLEDREAFKAQLGRSRLVALLSALATLLRSHRMWDLRIDWRDTVRELRTPTLFVGNNALQFEQLGLDEAQAVARGALGAIVLRPLGRLGMLGLLMRGAAGRLGTADEVISFAFRALQVKPARGPAKRRVRVAIDGELHWMAMPLAFGVAPEPLWLVKPPPDGTAP